MGDWFDNVRKLFRDNPRMWIVLSLAVVIGISTVWYVYGGFSFQIGRFFAVDIPNDNGGSPGDGAGGGTGGGGGGDLTPLPTPTGTSGGTAERCLGRSVQPPTWVPDSALEWLCDRDSGEDGDLDRQCVTWNEANKRSSGGEFGYKSRRFAEGKMSGGPAVQFPWYCVEFFDNCPEGGGNVWTAFGSGDSAVCQFSTTTSSPASSPATTGAPSGLPRPAQLSVVCNSSQNTLTWTSPLPPGSNAAAINKVSTAPGGSPVATQIGIDLGVNPRSYTDTNIRAGYTYTYRFKNHVAVASNTVTCPTNATTPTPTASTTPGGQCTETRTVTHGGGACPGYAEKFGTVCQSYTTCPFGSAASDLRIGHVAYDVPKGLLYNPGPNVDLGYQRWFWYSIPGSAEEWCASPDTGYRPAPAGAPSSPPTAGSERVRCPDGTSGSLNYERDFPNCGAAYTTTEVVSVPCPSATPTPQTSVAPGTPLMCTPVNQTVGLRQIADLQAFGGTGTYAWSVTQGGSLELGGNAYVGVSYATTGRKTLRVSSGGKSVACTVDVVSGAAPTPTPTSQGALLMVQKTGQNTTTGDPTDRSAITVFPGQTATFKIRISNNSPAALLNVRVKDSVPPGMSYVARSTRVEGQQILAESVTTGGLSVGRLESGETVTIEWMGLANQTMLIAPGPNQATPSVTVTADNNPESIALMSVTVYGSGATTGPGGVATGPGDAVVAALVTAAILTLLYGGYTRSPAYRRHDAQVVSRDQGPLDFRS